VYQYISAELNHKEHIKTKKKKQYKKIAVVAVWERGANRVPKKFIFFFKIKFFLYVSDRFDVLVSKIIFKK